MSDKPFSQTHENDHTADIGKMDDFISRQAAIDEIRKCRFVIDAIEKIKALPSAQPDLQPTCNNLATDTISRQAAIGAIEEYADRLQMVNWKENPNVPYKVHSLNWCINTIRDLPSAQPERLTDDDFETIRIHLNAQKEKLCNQRRLEEAEEYQRIIDRFMAFASAQPEIIRCKDCKHYQFADNRAFGFPVKRCEWTGFEDVDDDDFCSRAERRTDG